MGMMYEWIIAFETAHGAGCISVVARNPAGAVRELRRLVPLARVSRPPFLVGGVEDPEWRWPI